MCPRGPGGPKPPGGPQGSATGRFNLAAVLCLPASSCNVWDLVSKGLSHPATVWDLAVFWLGRGGGGGAWSSFCRADIAQETLPWPSWPW